MPLNAVIEEKDKDFSIYEVPLSLVENQLDELIVKRLQLTAGPLNLDNWRELLHRLRNPEHEISIAVVGKYAEHFDAYKSIYESLDHAGIHHRTQVRIGRVLSESIEREGPERLLAGYDGILVPGGFGERGIEGKVEAIRFARERGIPFFGICLGMQCAAIEFGRTVVGLENAHSTEFNKDTPHPVICLLDEQRNVIDKGGTMRLGAHPAKLEPGSRAHECYRTEADFRTPSTSLRIQQHVPAAVHRARHEVLGGEPGWIAGGNHGIAQSPLVRRRPVSPGIQIQTDGGSPAVRRIRRSRRPATCRPRRTSSRNRDDLAMNASESDKPKIIVDEDWKSRVQAERETGTTPPAAGAPESAAAPRISRFPKRRSPCS